MFWRMNVKIQKNFPVLATNPGVTGVSVLIPIDHLALMRHGMTRPKVMHISQMKPKLMK